VANTLAYYFMATITVVKVFIVQVPELNRVELSSSAPLLGRLLALPVN
jgi:hypothetical protein